MSNSAAGKACLKCGYQRTATDPGPDYACPACGAVYAKVEAALEARRAAERVKPPRANADIAPAVKAAGAAKFRNAGSGSDGDRARDDRLRSSATFLYVLSSPSALMAFLLLPVVYLVKRRASDSYVLSHFQWQITTLRRTLALSFFLFVCNALGISAVLRYGPSDVSGWALLALVGYANLGLAALVQVWFWYRVVRGLYHLRRREYAP